MAKSKKTGDERQRIKNDPLRYVEPREKEKLEY